MQQSERPAGQPKYERKIAEQMEMPAFAQRLTELRGNHIAAIFVQLGSFLTTLAFILSIGVDGWLGWGLSIVIEFVLFEMKRHEKAGVRWAANMADTLLNGGGLYFLVQNIDNTDVWKMLSEGMGLGAELGHLPALIISLVIGLILSGAPRLLWNQKGRRYGSKAP